MSFRNNLINCQRTYRRTCLLTVGDSTVGEVTDPAVSLAGQEPRLKRRVTLDDNVVATAL